MTTIDCSYLHLRTKCFRRVGSKFSARIGFGTTSRLRNLFSRLVSTRTEFERTWPSSRRSVPTPTKLFAGKNRCCCCGCCCCCCCGCWARGRASSSWSGFVFWTRFEMTSGSKAIATFAVSTPEVVSLILHAEKKEESMLMFLQSNHETINWRI